MFFNVRFDEGDDEAIGMTTSPIFGRESEKIFSFETEMSVNNFKAGDLIKVKSTMF